MTGLNNTVQEISFFDAIEESEAAQKLEVVNASFNGVVSMNWEDLFKGYDEIYAITYSSSIDFISRVLPNFKYAEIIFGFEAILEDSIAMIMSIQFSQLKFLANHKSANMLAKRLENETLKLMVSRETKSHEKIYVLKADNGRVRVITGSANFSYSAFNGIQRENITYMDNIEAYDYYRGLFEQFKDKCADNVVHSSITRIMADPDAAQDKLMELVPIVETVKVKKAIILEETTNPEYLIAADASDISKDIKPIMPKADKHGKIVLSPTDMSKAKRKYQEFRDTKIEERKKMPQLHIDVERKIVTFNDKVCNLNPQKEKVQADLQHFFEYMEGFDSFSGDVEKNRRTYFLFAVWYLASPFMPYLRFIAHNNGQDKMQFPVYAILYGESNGGKTGFTSLLTKMMCGRIIPVNKSGDFTTTTIDCLKQLCEGIPIVIDDLTKTQYSNHISNIVKCDEWGLKEKLIFYPSIAITTNEIPSITGDISKRAFVCHIDSCLDKEKNRAKYKKVTSCINAMTNSFYCEYIRRMMKRIDNMVNEMQGTDENYLPDIFAESSATIIEIAREYYGDNLPSYVFECDYNDYFGNKAVGRNAIQKIRKEWQYNRDAFTINKKRDLLEYRILENGSMHYLKYIRQELPPSLNAEMTSRTLTMSLGAAKDFFGIDFKKSIFDSIRKK